MSTPVVVVQGKPVAASQGGFATTGLETTAPPPASASSNDYQGRKESSCNDPFFVVLFYAAVVGIVAVAALYGPAALDEGDATAGTTEPIDYTGYVILTLICTGISLFGAGLGMAVLFCIPEFLIKAALIFTVILAGVMMIMSFLSGSVMGGVIGLIFFAITCCYARAVWSRIPFATANLVTACTAVRANLGIAVYAYMFALLAGAWSLAWALAFVGVFDQTYDCNDATGVCDNPSYGMLFLLFLAFFFVEQVIQNSIHVVTAGTVGTWWYAPDECGCCASAVNNSFIRTMTTSFGSICFGSLLVAILQALRAIAQQARENGDAQIFACIAECILGCLAAILEYFNKWAFVYVGLYGMNYLKAGKSVFELFRNRGWEAVIADDLVGNVLFLISLLVGLVMGGIGLAAQEFGDLLENAPGNDRTIAFFLGFLVGLVITSILMSTIASGVNAVIVLFAEGPREFQENHPELSNKMREAWNLVYPGSV